MSVTYMRYESMLKLACQYLAIVCIYACVNVIDHVATFLEKVMNILL